nr:hypothetical protein [Arabidopsis thaliana]
MTKREYNSQPEMLEGAKSIGAGAATIASAGAAIGIGNVFSSLIHSVARNPSLAKQSFGYAILGFALTEAIAFHILAGFGKFSADVFTVFMGTFSVTGSSGGIVNHQDGASSEWFTYTSDMVEDSASSGRTSSSVNQPIPEEQAWEREARAQEHDRISAEVETITSACANLEAAMVRKAQILLHQRGVTLGDPEDVKRALQLALHDDWEHAIDDRKRHFTVLRRNFGTARCERWNPFIDELRGLGNHQVNARHYVD